MMPVYQSHDTAVHPPLNWPATCYVKLALTGFPEFARGTIVLRERKVKKQLWLPIFLALAALSAGCNTMEGLGQDVERGGEKIQQQAK